MGSFTITRRRQVATSPWSAAESVKAVTLSRSFAAPRDRRALRQISADALGGVARAASPYRTESRMADADHRSGDVLSPRVGGPLDDNDPMLAGAQRGVFPIDGCQ